MVNNGYMILLLNGVLCNISILDVIYVCGFEDLVLLKSMEWC